MTTAHRPTYNPTKGGNIQGANKLYYPTQQYSSKDLPANLKIKSRQFGQGTIREIKRKDFKRELLERENRAKGISTGTGLVSSLYSESEDFSNVDITSDLLELEAPKKKQRLDSLSVSEIKSQQAGGSIASESAKDTNKTDFNNVFVQDKDLEFDESEEDEDIKRLKGNNNTNENENENENENYSEQSENSEEDEEDEEDEEELLYKEYEKIKRMREEEAKQKEMEEAEAMKLNTQEQILTGNPLLNTGASYSLKKKWFEDTIFKNQAKNEQKVKKRFINDTVRSDFHRKFLSKTIQ